MKKIYLAIVKNRYLGRPDSLDCKSYCGHLPKQRGVNCLSEISRKENMSLENSQELEQLRTLFFITNSYFYSLFGLIIGLIIIIVWYSKYRNVWRSNLTSNVLTF